MHNRLQEGARRQYNRAGPIARTTAHDHALYAVSVCMQFACSILGLERACRLNQQIVYRLLYQLNSWIVFNEPLNFLLICLFIGLSPRTMHGGPLTAIEHAELNSRSIDHLPHQASEGIDFANNLALSDSPDRRIAAHLPDRIQIASQQGDICTQASGSGSCLRPRMTSPDDNDIERIVRATLIPIYHHFGFRCFTSEDSNAAHHNNLGGIGLF
jgi:hypothetical protein